MNAEQHFTYLIIGGGLAGTTAAETIRQHDTDGSLAIVSDEPYHLYSRVMLSKPSFFLKKVPFDTVWLKKDEWYDEKKVTFIGGRRVTHIDPENKIATLDDQSHVSYEKLLLAVGADARIWSPPGAADKKGIYPLRTLDHCKSILERLDNTEKSMTIGGGIISLEVAELLKESGKEVTMLIREDHYLAHTLDEESAAVIEKAIIEHDISLIKNAVVAEVHGDEYVQSVTLEDGQTIEADMIVTGIGVESDLQWLTDSGVEVRRGIVADEYLQTNHPDIYTAGDIAEFNDLLLEETAQFGSWSNAREQGKAAGLNMVGKHQPFKYVSFYNTQILGNNVAFVGDVRKLDDRIIIERSRPEKNSYVRILIVGKELVGATLINQTDEMRALTDLIQNNVDVSDKHAALADPNVDLASIH